MRRILSAVEDALQGLIDHSLVAIEQVDPPRYRLLESARDYALLRLARAGEEHTTRHRHARALHALFEALDSAYWAPDKAEVPSPSAHAAEIANLRVATSEMVDWLTRDYKMEPWAAHLLIGYQGQYDVVTVAGSMALRIPKSALPR